MKILIFLMLFISHSAMAFTVEELFKQKKYQEVASLFDSPRTFNQLTNKDMVLVSYSLRALGRYRDNTRLIVVMIKKLYAKEHADIFEKIQKKVTLDADDYPKSLVLLYWNIYNDYASIIKSYKKTDPQLEKDKNNFQNFRNILSELEFREGKVEKTNDQVTTHLQYLSDINYKFTASWQFQYMSWQYSANMVRNSTGKQTDLIITNQGVCLGGDVGYESGFYHYALEGCFLMGSGGVTAYGTPEITYKQNLTAYGIKLGPSAYKIVSSSKSRIGISLPILYSTQKMTQPDDTDYVVDQDNTINFVPTLNARWQFDKWYIKTEFGQYFKKKETLWALGMGRQF
jgi:hypothetical protein